MGERREKRISVGVCICVCVCDGRSFTIKLFWNRDITE